MQQFAIIFLSILLEALPFVLVGTIISSLIEIFVSREWLATHLPKKSIVAYLVAGMAGLIFPVCECAIVPIMRRLVKKGMPIGVAITFMLATPTINPIVLLSTHYAFPNNYYFPLFRGLVGYLAAVSIGLIMAFLSDKSEVKESEDEAENGCACCSHEHGHCVEDKHAHSHHEDGELCDCGHHHAKKGDKPLKILYSVLEHTSKELYEVGRFLILGVFISSAMQTFVPKQFFLTLSQNPSLSILMMMVLAFVLSLCSEADAFIAASFRNSLPNASIMAFLIFGPMMDIKNTIMLSGGFKMKFVIRLIVAISVVVFIFSSILNFIF